MLKTKAGAWMLNLVRESYHFGVHGRGSILKQWQGTDTGARPRRGNSLEVAYDGEERRTAGRDSHVHVISLQVRVFQFSGPSSGRDYKDSKQAVLESKRQELLHLKNKNISHGR
jgi:hypothetical protein